MSLAAPTSMHTTAFGSGSALHQAVEQFSASAAEPLRVERHRELFQERALRDVTINSNETAMMLDPANPLLVKEEMDTQKDYFRRLKFTYLEQEAKRNFLFSITGDEPQGVQPGENEELESINAEKKAALRATKADIEEMRLAAVDLARENATRNVEVRQRLAEAQSLQKQIRDAELELARIKAKYPMENRLTVAQAGEILDQQIAEIQRATEAIGTTSRKVDVAREAVSRTAKEVQRLGREREREEARAKEVQQGREAGDTKVDELCRWLSSSIAFYRTLLGIRSVRATTEGSLQLLHLEYDVPSAPPIKTKGKAVAPAESVTLVLGFESATRRFVNAQLVNSDINIDEPIHVAVRGNDVPGLVADVLMRLRPAVA